MLSAVGLILIIAGWAVQFNEAGRKSGNIGRTFLVLYALGALFLAYDSRKMGLGIIAFLNLVCFAGAIMVLLKNR